MHFIPNQLIHTMLLGETIDHVILVFPNPFDQIGGNSNIQRAVAFAG